MSLNIFYTGTKETKTGKSVPVLSNGKTLFSEYNPERDIQFFSGTKEVQESGFILIGGLGDASHISAVLEKNPSATIMVLEFNSETIDFLFSNGICSKNILQNNRILLTTPQTLCTDIKNNYIPIIHGTFLYHPVKSWQLQYDSTSSKSLKDELNETLHDIASDYATQARFGKLMFVNILKNIALLSKLTERESCSLIQSIASTASDKEAAVIGAGPTLDESIKLLKKYSERFFIISTDTAYGTLYHNGIKPDVVVTIDGQISSIAHFIGIDSSKTTVAADICANAAAARHLYKQGCKMRFFTTGHPMGTLVNDWFRTVSKDGSNLLPVLSAGSGTVLSAAADLAVKAGFGTIRFFGADFAYKSGKPYTRGTYLDAIYSSSSMRLAPLENSFCSLCYRTELTEKDGKFTNSLLSSYKQSLGSYIASHSEAFSFEASSDKLQALETKQNIRTQEKSPSPSHNFSYKDFFDFFIANLENKDKNMLYSLLPFATWLKEKEKNADINDIYTKAAELAALRRS